MEEKLTKKPMSAIKKAFVVAAALAVVGAGIAIFFKNGAPKRAIRHYKTHGKVQKPRKHYRTLRKRQQRINKAKELEQQ